MSAEPLFAYAYINAKVMPLDRGEMYEDPLIEALEGNGWAEVTGGGTGQTEEGEIEYCGIDLDLHDVEQAVPFICQILTECGAPRGSKLEYEVEGRQHEVPFGVIEGLGLYFNGTDLPDEVYQQNDINDVYEEINRLLEDRGQILGHWNGPTESALYLYGFSREDMKQRIAGLMSTNPLCQKIRYVELA
jgi:hypothetical protein